jgi:hypothetical protein
VELKFKGGQVRHGFSGGPLLNRRTWRVIGVVAVTRDARSPLGGFAKPLVCIEALVSGAGQAMAPVDPRWTDAEVRQRQPAKGAASSFTPEQLRQLRLVLQGPDSPDLKDRIEALSAELGKEGLLKNDGHPTGGRWVRTYEIRGPNQRLCGYCKVPLI